MRGKQITPAGMSRQALDAGRMHKENDVDLPAGSLASPAQVVDKMSVERSKDKSEIGDFQVTSFSANLKPCYQA